MNDLRKHFKMDCKLFYFNYVSWIENYICLFTGFGAVTFLATTTFIKLFLYHIDTRIAINAHHETGAYDISKINL